MAAAIDGILLLDKPLGLSSNAALQRVKQLFGARKAGHSGSLDPLAGGMLPVCLGEATKIAGALLDARKCYRFTVRLGARTSTGDVEGEIVERRDVPALQEQAVRSVLATFLGPRLQVPPMYSALKHDGQRLYALARQGMEVPREARPVELYEIALEGFEAGALTVRVVCSKGTYVRVLAEEIAVALGTCGHVSVLRRLWVQPFGEEQMVTLDALGALKAQGGGLERHLLPPDSGLVAWPRVDLDELQAERLLHGQKLRLLSASSLSLSIESGPVRVYGPGERFLGLAEYDSSGLLRPRRLIATLQTSG